MNDRKVIPFNQSGSFYFNQGLKKIDQQKKGDALKNFEKAFNADEDNLAYLSQYVYLLAENGRHAEAEYLLINKFIQHQYDAEFYFILSQLFVITNDPNKAFLFGVEYAKHFPEAGYHEELENMFELAIEDEEEVEKEAERFVSHHIFQHLFMNARIEESLEYLSMLPLDLQEERTFRNLKAMAYLFLNQFDEAYELLRQLHMEDKTDMHALSHLTLLYYHTGREAEFEANLKKMEVVEPLDDDSRFKVGLVLNFLKQYSRSYELLYPLYKNQQYISFQLLHALSFASYHTGREEEARMFWEKMQNFHAVSDVYSPWEKERAADLITVTAETHLHEDDVHLRLLGLYKLHLIRPRDAILGHPVWETIEALDDYEKLYVTFLFQGVKLVRLGKMHNGLEILRGAGYEGDEDLLQWIDTFHLLYDRIKDFEDIPSLVAATVYLYPKGRKITKKSMTEEFGITSYRLNKAIGMIKQI
ncbi:tetratricopeptide repeat protein [Salinicoccus kekensis]|uniref:Tetratricopeptide repeat protein n=1 Tax=Salinicoccus kekensis TaxID=714307 RepID=A0A285UVQ9_9STAP|nr:hypothetical protein [Salinicoccus kekensis]SOC44341.1 hypothetical protein SAMN05878391_2297 [Salinicoccus kekensis]